MQRIRLIGFAWLAMLAIAPLALGNADAVAARANDARAELAMQDDEPRIRAELVVHPDDIDRQDVRTGVLLEIDEGWHVYGAEAGETGIPTRVVWSAAGGTLEPLPWPQTEWFGDADLGIEGQGYTGSVLLPARARFPNGPGVLRAEVSLLACKDECIPAEARLELPIEQAATQGAAAERARVAFGSASEASAGAWLEALLFALVGGLLLNLMPCVLPVLAIKALALTELAERGPGEARRQGAAYAAGVISSLLALAACVAALRAAGAAVGWGFQFQEPIYVAGLGAVLVLFALNLFGVFEIQATPYRLASLGAAATGARRSFFDGLLTVALATPCSAPFLGTAVGFALAGDPAWIFPIFFAVGVGLALPLALVAANPRVARFLPKPGAWMQELRALLGFLLLATVVWLAWVLGRNAGTDVTARWLAWLLAVAFVGWRFGARQKNGRRTPAWLALGTAALVLVSGVGLVHTRAVDAESEASLHGARPWSRADVDAALRIGRPVFVFFTADWCLTCKANERLVLRDERIGDALKTGNFEVLEGDWTRRDADIARELARFGRSGVPFYAVFAPETRPELLPELLTTETVLEALARAERASTVSRVTRAAHATTMQSTRGR